MTFSATLPGSVCPLAAVRPLDPELLAAGPAEMARCLLKGPADDHSAESWRDDLAHIAAMQLTTPARAALVLATDRLLSLLQATEAMEAAGLALARELERQSA